MSSWPFGNGFAYTKTSFFAGAGFFAVFVFAGIGVSSSVEITRCGRDGASDADEPSRGNAR